jgi:hypothetical protein
VEVGEHRNHGKREDTGKREADSGYRFPLPFSRFPSVAAHIGRARSTFRYTGHASWCAPRQPAGAHQELAHDLAAGEAEGLLEELHPLVLGQRVVRREPAVEAAVALAQPEQGARVVHRRLHLEPVADDAGVGQQPLHVTRAEPRHHHRVEAAVRRLERRPLLEDGEPGEPRLVDLQDEPLEQLRVGGEREAVLAVVIRTMPLVAGGDVAVGGHGWSPGARVRSGKRETGNGKRETGRGEGPPGPVGFGVSSV